MSLHGKFIWLPCILLQNENSMWWTTKTLCLVFSKIKLAKNVWQKKHAKIFAAGLLLTENSRGNVIYCFPSGLLRNYLVLDVREYKATFQFWVSLLRAGRECEGRDEMGWKQYLKMYALLPQFSTEPRRRRRLLKLGGVWKLFLEEG